jgi:hypothetical protein
MPLLGGLLLSLFTGLASFFGRWFAKKGALAAAAIATFTGLTAALYTGMIALIAGIVAALPSSSAWPMAMWLFLPDNAAAVVSVCLGVDTAVGLYRWNVENLRIASYIT